MKRSASYVFFRHHLLAFFNATVHNGDPGPNINVECSGEFSLLEAGLGRQPGFKLIPRLRGQHPALPTCHGLEHHRTRQVFLDLARHDHSKQEPAGTDRCFGVLAPCLGEGMCVRKGGVVGPWSALDANDL